MTASNEVTKPATFTCTRCGMTSSNPIDRAEGYCGNCHDWTAGPVILRRACPNCGNRADAAPYDIGDGPELSCPSCEWCWGAIGQRLTPIPPEITANPAPWPPRADWWNDAAP